MATHPFGAGLFVDHDSNGSYTEIAEVVSITPPAVAVGQAQSTVLKSSGAWRTYVPGFKDGQTFSFVVRFNSQTLVNYSLFLDLLRTICPWRIVFPIEEGFVTAAQLDFGGFISEGPAVQEMNSENDEVIDVMVTVKITGSVVFTDATT